MQSVLSGAAFETRKDRPRVITHNTKNNITHTNLEVLNTRQIFTKALCPALFAAMLFASSSVFAQVKIGTNPTTINAANNLEVEASTAGRKTSIDKTTGQVTIADGTQKFGRVFTSDGNGAGSWQAGVVFAGYATSQSVEQDNAGTIINIIPDFDPESAWNSATKEYTISEAGYYSISFSGINIFDDGYSNPVATGGFALQQSGETIQITEMTSLENRDMPVGSALVVKAAAGDKIKLISSTQFLAGPQTWTMKKAAMTISLMVKD
ncbi:hypothetical protein L0657_13745 [Dyadobacter sp. CY345]|uniref:hypothetical protein n=1 Tax=Dyadobacter sp. CY345 TaxID=2909335 RepID=UPI001F36165C|nr:hypothetical protein [Dyadobacter sp. CY345]MCF2445025.1 hypothetical protein [Dyadobacter sp. CY345]